MHDTVPAFACGASSPARPNAVRAKPPSRMSESRLVSGVSSTAPNVSARSKNALRVRLDEAERPRPRVFGRRGELLLLAVEEAVRRTLVRHQLVLDARRLETLLEGGVVLGRDVLIVSGLQRQDRCLQLRGSSRRIRRAAVEPDRACQAVLVSGGEPGVAATKAEADREDRLRAALAQVSHGSSDIRLHALRRRLLDVRHVLELVVALLGSRGTAEVVEGDG